MKWVWCSVQLSQNKRQTEKRSLLTIRTKTQSEYATQRNRDKSATRIRALFHDQSRKHAILLLPYPSPKTPDIYSWWRREERTSSNGDIIYFIERIICQEHMSETGHVLFSEQGNETHCQIQHDEETWMCNCSWNHLWDSQASASLFDQPTNGTVLRITSVADSSSYTNWHESLPRIIHDKLGKSVYSWKGKEATLKHNTRAHPEVALTNFNERERRQV